MVLKNKPEEYPEGEFSLFLKKLIKEKMIRMFISRPELLNQLRG